MMEAIPELIGQGYVEIVDEVYRTGKPYLGAEMPAFIEKVKGKPEQIYVNLHCQPIQNEQGTIEGILVFSYDVTELVLSRKHLERNAEMLQNLYLNAPAYVATLQGSTYIYDLVNPAYQNLFGSREIIGKPILEALPELKGQGFDKLLDNVYNTGEIFVGNEMLSWLAYDKGLEPAERYFNFSYQPIYDFNKKITGILIFGYEVTEQVLARKMQDENAERFRILADAMPQKMWMADERGNLNYFNQQWFEYTRKSFDELKGLGWEKIIHPNDWNHNKQTWINSINTGEDFQLEHRFLCHDGAYYWHLSRGRAQKNSDGKITVWIGTHTDIDEQKRKEQQKDEFIGIASHEMKTPLTTAKAYLQLLELSLDKENATTKLYAKKASFAVDRLNELIGELMDVSKIQSGKLDYNITAFNFNEMVDEAVENIRDASPKHALIKTGKAEQEVTGDKQRLQQVVINLLSNAVKYSPNASQVSIHIEEQNGEIHLSVKDEGIGISKEHLKKVFERYYRVEEHAIQFQGLGIGLFISCEIISRHHGQLWAASEEGKGTTFHFTLPLNNE